MKDPNVHSKNEELLVPDHFTAHCEMTFALISLQFAVISLQFAVIGLQNVHWLDSELIPRLLENFEN